MSETTQSSATPPATVVFSLAGRARLRCEAEHESPWLTGLHVFLRPKPVGAVDPYDVPFTVARVDAEGYLVPAFVTRLAKVPAIPLVPGTTYELYLLRHPDPEYGRRLTLMAGWASGPVLFLEREFGAPVALTPAIEVTNPKPPKGPPVKEVVLRVPEAPDLFHPKGAALYAGWTLFRDMPNASCPCVRDQVSRLQHHLGALRYPVGASGAPYVPEPKKGLIPDDSGRLVPAPPPGSAADKKIPDDRRPTFSYEFPNESVFDVATWNSVLAFQRDAKAGRALACPKRPHDALLSKMEPTRVEGWRRADTIRLAHDYAVTAPAPASATCAKVTVDGFVEKQTAQALTSWVTQALRRPDRVLVPLEATPGQTNWLLWVRDDSVAPYRAWIQSARHLGFAHGVALNHTYRDARVDAGGAGYGRAKLSIHKTGLAFDLRMHRFHFTEQGTFDVWFVREKPEGRTSWRVYGRAKKTPNLAAQPELFTDTIAPWQYDAIDLDGGKPGPCPQLAPGETFIDLTAVGKRHGFLPIHSFASGWYGTKEETIVLDSVASFERAVKKLETLVKQHAASVKQVGVATEFIDRADSQGTNKPRVGGGGQLLMRRDDAVFDREEGRRRLAMLGLDRETVQVLERDAQVLALWLKIMKERGPTPDVRISKPADAEKLQKLIRKVFVGRDIFVFAGVAAEGSPERVTVSATTVLPAAPFIVRPCTEAFDATPGTTVEFPRLFGEAIGMEWWHFQMTETIRGRPWLSLLEELGWTREGLGDAQNPGPFRQTGLGYTAEDLEANADGTRSAAEKAREAAKAQEKANAKKAAQDAKKAQEDALKAAGKGKMVPPRSSVRPAARTTTNTPAATRG